jgi:hypothetical protein
VGERAVNGEGGGGSWEGGGAVVDASSTDVDDVCVDLGGGGKLKRGEGGGGKLQREAIVNEQDVNEKLFFDALFREDPAKKRSIKMQTDGDAHAPEPVHFLKFLHFQLRQARERCG